MYASISVSIGLVNDFTIDDEKLEQFDDTNLIFGQTCSAWRYMKTNGYQTRAMDIKNGVEYTVKAGYKVYGVYVDSD